MNNNRRSSMYAVIAVVLAVGGYCYSNVGLTAVAMLALLLSIYASDVIKRKNGGLNF